jgi:Ala-tRNA(Pro) deacylase
VLPREEAGRTILAWLDKNRLSYRLYRHERADTIEDCLRMPFIDGSITICKNVFLCNRQQTAFHLMLLRPETPFRTAVVSRALGVSRLSFAPESALGEILGVTAGSVSPLGLYFDRRHCAALCYEAAVRNTPSIAFHPCDNAATVIFSQEVFWNGVLPALDVTPSAIEKVE